MGVSYMAVAAEHPLAVKAAETDSALRGFLAECQRSAVSEAAMETMEKMGRPLGVNALHPITGEPIRKSAFSVLPRTRAHMLRPCSELSAPAPER